MVRAAVADVTRPVALRTRRGEPLGEPALEAIIVPRGAEPPAEADLVEHCRRHLEAYKVPRTFTYAAVLPRNEMGKLLRSTPP